MAGTPPTALIPDHQPPQPNPNVFSHIPIAAQHCLPIQGDATQSVFEKYWNYLPNLEERPEFCQESEFTQGCMTHFSSALSRLGLTDFMSRVSAEAKQSDLETVEDAQSADCV
jgi:hypothetical protein